MSKTFRVDVVRCCTTSYQRRSNIVCLQGNHKEFSWYVLIRAPKNTRKKRILEAYLIKSINPSLNEKLDKDVLMLFRISVT